MEEIVKKTLEYLQAGKIILYPTDTIWGIGCDAMNAKAVQNIYKIKQRAEQKSLIILLDTVEKLASYMEKVPPIAYDLIKSIDSPLTIIYPGAKNLPKQVVAHDNTIAIRVVRNDFCKKLIKQFQKPIVSTSANISDDPAPLIFSKISKKLKAKVDYIVEWEQESIKEVKPSMIIKLEVDGEFKIIRK